MSKAIRIWYFSAFMLLALSIHAQEATVAEFHDAPLREVILFLESQFDVSFSFKDENLVDERINLTVKDQPLQKILGEVFGQTKLRFSFVDTQNLVLFKHVENEKTITICGFVKQAGTSEPLVGANIRDSHGLLGTYSNITGRFELTIQRNEADTLILSYIGFLEKKVSIEQLIKSPCNTYYLEAEALTFAPILVREYLTEGIGMKEGGNTITVDPPMMGLIPGSIESDVFSTIQLLPGISSPNETASGLFVRGGTPDQNLILWDGVPVYHTGHMFGMISAFNPYSIHHIDVYRSAISSIYGGRASSVIDIQPNQYPADQWRGHAGINMTHAHLSTEFPLWEKSGLQFSGRSSIAKDLVTPTFRRYAEKVFQGSKIDFEGNQQVPVGVPTNDQFTFGDLHLKWQWHPGKSKISSMFFVGSNELDYKSDIDNYIFSRDVLNVQNTGIKFEWEHDWAPQFSSVMSVYDSEYSSDYALNLSLFDDIDRVLFEATRTNKLNDLGLKMQYIWTPFLSHQLNFGYQFSDQNIDIQIQNNNENQVNIDSSSYQSKVHNVFAEYAFTNEIVTLNAGLRYQREPTLEGDFFAPRMSLHTKVNDAIEIKLSSSKQFQFISQLVILNLNDIGVGNEIWIASDKNGIPVIEATQWAAGLLFQKNGWAIDFEGYVKELSGVTTLSSGFGELPEQPFSHGNLNVRGIDILAKKRINNWRTWISYTLARAEYEFQELNPLAFPASHDHRHSIQWVHNIKSDPWEFSLGWQFRSGLPYTPHQGIDTLTNNNGEQYLYIKYADQNSKRLKPYHRLDASVLYHFSKNRKVNGFIGLSFQNIYGRVNQLGRNFLLDNNNSPENAYSIVQIDKASLRFTPNAVVKISW